MRPTHDRKVDPNGQFYQNPHRAAEFRPAGATDGINKRHVWCALDGDERGHSTLPLPLSPQINPVNSFIFFTKKINWNENDLIQRSSNDNERAAARLGATSAAVIPMLPVGVGCHVAARWCWPHQASSTHLAVGFSRFGGFPLGCYSTLGKLGSHFLFPFKWCGTKNRKIEKRKTSRSFGDFKNPAQGCVRRWLKRGEKNPSPSPFQWVWWRQESPFKSADHTAAQLKLKDVGDKTVSISTAPQNRPESPPMGVAGALCPIWSPGTGLLHPLCLCNSLLLQVDGEHHFLHC